MNIEGRFGKHGSRDNNGELGNKISGKSTKYGDLGCKVNNGKCRSIVRLVIEVR